MVTSLHCPNQAALLLTRLDIQQNKIIYILLSLPLYYKGNQKWKQKPQNKIIYILLSLPLYYKEKPKMETKTTKEYITEDWNFIKSQATKPFVVVGLDDYELPGEKLFIVDEFDSEAKANDLANTDDNYTVYKFSN